MAKEIEKLGIATVHLCTIIPISQTVGANRILPGVAIPNPTGNPNLDQQEEFMLRKNLMLKALESLKSSVEKQTVF
jgi:glycine reductase